MMRLAVIIALALCLVPREAALRIAQSAYANGVDIVTLCERRPEECREISDKIKEAGVLLTDFASRSAVQAQGLVENAIEQMRQSGAVSAAERGTLNQEDLKPVWRGSQGVTARSFWY